MSVPNSLSIILETRIPGYEKIQYKPLMTNPKINPNMDKVYFDPLVKLTKSAIDSVPPYIQKNQFFDKNLFYTLENRVLSSFMGSQKESKEHPLVQLKFSKENGTFSQNIRLTLDTLFKPGTVIYIGNKPYTIYDYYWDSDNWKMEPKTTLSYFPQNYVFGGPYNRYGRQTPIVINVGNQTSNYDIARREAEKEFKKIPRELVAGDEYDEEKFSELPSLHKLEWNPDISTFDMVEKRDPIVAPAYPLDEKKELISPSAPTIVIAEPIDSSLTKTGKGTVASTKSSSFSFPKLFKGGAGDDGKKTARLRGYFKEYYDLVEPIYTVLKGDLEKYNILPPPKPMIKSKYEDNLVPQLSVDNILGDGNCFFTCISEAINRFNDLIRYFNEENNFDRNYPSMKIEYRDKLTRGDIFESIDIRKMVLDYYMNDKIKLKEQLEIANNVCEEMNNLFNEEKEIIKNEKSTPEEKISSIENAVNEIYIDRYVPFIIKSETDISRPFTVVKYENEKDVINVQDYIMNSVNPKYWGDDTTIQIIQIMINLKVITIYEDKDGNMSCPFPNLTDSQISIDGREWDKYLFVYHRQLHYDLLWFGPPKLRKKNTDNLPDANLVGQIFLRNPIELYNILVPQGKREIGALDDQQVYKFIYDYNLVPPIYIILFIYGFYYKKLKGSPKVELFNDYFHIFNDAYNIIQLKSGKNIKSILSKADKKETESTDISSSVENFTKNFKKIFGGDTGETRTTEKVVDSILPIAKPIEVDAEPVEVMESTVETKPTGASGPSGATDPGTSSVASGVGKNTSPLSADSKSTYIIYVDLELYPGTEIPLDKRASLGCSRNLENVRLAWAQLRGLQYRKIPLNYYEGYGPKEINRAFKSQTRKNMSPDSNKNLKRGGKSKTCKNKKYKI
jgi:hypothetical protein